MSIVNLRACAAAVTGDTGVNAMITIFLLFSQTNWNNFLLFQELVRFLSFCNYFQQKNEPNAKNHCLKESAHNLYCSLYVWHNKCLESLSSSPHLSDQNI
jgi:hypothetical protein